MHISLDPDTITSAHALCSNDLLHPLKLLNIFNSNVHSCEKACFITNVFGYDLLRENDTYFSYQQDHHSEKLHETFHAGNGWFYQ